MEYKKENWQDYKERLISYRYNEEQLIEVEKVRAEYDHMTFEQFDFLFRQGVVKRTAKLRKPRNLYLSESGTIYFLSHYHKSYVSCGHFINEKG
jgi:hypothetical protein